MADSLHDSPIHRFAQHQLAGVRSGAFAWARDVDVLDAQQTVALKAWIKKLEHRGDEPEGHTDAAMWDRRVLRNQLYDDLRGAARRREHETRYGATRPVTESSHEIGVSLQDEVAMVVRELRVRLPERMFRVFVARAVHGCEYAEIAAAQGLRSPAHARLLVFRARVELAAFVEQLVHRT